MNPFTCTNEEALESYKNSINREGNKMETMTLNFKYVETVYNGGNHWIADNFKVVYYPLASPKPFYAAYYAVKKLKSGGFQFGNSCFHNNKVEPMRYNSKQDAFNACEEYLNIEDKNWDYVS